MADQWYYAIGDATEGPVDRDTLASLASQGQVKKSTLVWRDGLKDWVEAGTLDGLFPKAAPPPPPAPARRAPAPPPAPAPRHVEPAAPAAPLSPGASIRAAAEQRDIRGVLGGLGAKISEVADLPTISDINVKHVLVGGLSHKFGEGEIEETFAVGTEKTTPPLSEVQAGWPAPRVFWRVLAGCAAAYVLMRLGITEFKNTNFIPGLIVIGSFVVPLSCVILFFELNTPKNVSIYQVVKMVLIGGALSLVLTMLLFRFIPGSGTGAVIPAMLTGVGEETGKALALVLVLTSMRYPWQLNGILFGAAVGAGFAGFESAGYAFNSPNMAAVFDSIMLRAILSPGGHVIWTAMIGAAIWRVKGNKKFELSMLMHPIVVRRWCIAVVLHGIWDTNLVVIPWYVQMPILSVVGWYLILAMLKQAYGGLAQVKESLAAAA